MTDFTMKIAGHTAAVHAFFDSTPHYFHAYLHEGPADFSITVTREDMDFEQTFLREEALTEGLRAREFPPPFLERAVIQRKFAEFLFDRDILLLHGSTVAVDQRAYLFTAPCGTGKSTHTRLWRELFGQRAKMVNDDKPFLHITGTQVLASGSPWSGKHGLDSNITLPLGGICLLRRGEEDRIAPITPEQMLPILLHQGCPPLSAQKQARYRELVGILAKTVPLWQMECTKTLEAARVASHAMGADKK